VIEGFAATAANVQAGDGDGVEIHGSHGYLLSNFLSPYWNRRDDAWGGDTARRARLAVEIGKAVRKRTPEDHLRQDPARAVARSGSDAVRRRTAWTGGIPGGRLSGAARQLSSRAAAPVVPLQGECACSWWPLEFIAWGVRPRAHNRRLRMNRRKLIAAAVSAAALVMPGLAASQAAWPSQPIKLIVPYPAGERNIKAE